LSLLLLAMAQKKLFRFAQIKTFPNVLEHPEGMKGQWRKFFKNDHPVVLELACGRGEYTVALGNLFPGKNFIGIDIKGNRMYIGAKKAIDEGLSNAAFLRSQVEKINDYFDAGEIDEIWITFPDPQLRTSKAKKRLTHPRFLRLYQQVIKPGGAINLKTDSPQLYDFTKKVIKLYQLELVEDMDDAYAEITIPDELKIKTHYESLDIAGSKKIHYLKFRLPYELEDLDAELKQMISADEQ
jgi:tRNA (guanine-N7-)-methyltransferase